MNPNATPFQSLKRTYTNAFEKSFYSNLNMAMAAPLAPITDLTVAQKKQMQAKPIAKNITFEEFVGISTAFSVAHSVLE
jgi:hypothetical protein